MPTSKTLILKTMKRYVFEVKEGYFLEVDVPYPEKLHNLYINLPFLPEIMKIENVEKLPAFLHDKTEYINHIKNLKHTLNYDIALKEYM